MDLKRPIESTIEADIAKRIRLASDSSSSSDDINFSDDDIPLVPFVTEVEIKDEPVDDDDFQIDGVESDEEIINFDHERIIDESTYHEEAISDSVATFISDDLIKQEIKEEFEEENDPTFD